MSAADNMTEHTVELPAVDLDDAVSGPATTAWAALVEAGDVDTFIEHDDDAEKFIGLPRPSWAPIGRDLIGVSTMQTAYRSEIAAVPSTIAPRHDCPGEGHLLARANVSAQLRQDGMRGVAVALHPQHPEPRGLALTFTVDEARRLAGVLLAAADLAGMP